MSKEDNGSSQWEQKSPFEYQKKKMEAVKGWIELTNNEMGIIDGSGWTVEHEGWF